MGRFTAGDSANAERLERIMNAKQRLIGVSGSCMCLLALCVLCCGTAQHLPLLSWACGKNAGFSAALLSRPAVACRVFIKHAQSP